MKGDKEYCKINSYIKETKTYVVETVHGHRRGLLPMTENQRANNSMLNNARQTGKQILLLCKDVIDGNGIYTSNLSEDVTSKDVVSNKILTIPLTDDDRTFQESLFNALYDLISNTINSDAKYEIAKQLLALNKGLKIKQNLYKDFFLRCSTKYAIRFWQEGILTFCNNYWISKLWKEGNDEEKENILNKLGIDLPSKIPSVKALFTGIAAEIINLMSNAQSTIKIAVAWFTNFDLFNCLKACLNRGVKVTLIINNDLINNGGYCLNFNELIDEGLHLHLVEYPEMLHYKFCIIDDEIVMTGSYNWTFYAEEINKEDAIIIQNDPAVISDFTSAFNELVMTYSEVSEMPDTVPYRPQFDRSSFKEYISEELVIRTRRNIGNARENLLTAKRLSPNNNHVIAAINHYRIEDNTTATIQEIEQTTAQDAIAIRRERTQELMEERQVLEQRVQTISESQKNLEQRQTYHQEETTQRLANASSERERVEIQEQSHVQANRLEQEREHLQTQSDATKAQIVSVSEEIEKTEQEIEIIEKTSEYEIIGGRGKLRINLKWATIDDLDLHVICPDGAEIYYRSKQHTCQNSLGQLDVDANAGSPFTTTPQENIYWEDKAPLGKYKVSVQLYSKRSGNNRIPFTVTIIPNQGESRTFSKWLATEEDTRDIVEFEYGADGLTYLE